MSWQIRRFVDIFRDQGLREALSRSYQYAKLDLLKMTNGLKYEVPDGLYRPLFERKYGTGIDVVDRDWDNLIVLDAYRYDYFEDHSRFDGELSRVLTHGNWSMEWVLKNFRGEDLTDTAIVSGNVFYERLGQDSVFSLDSLDRDPEEITETARDVNERYPNKRLIVHYMTPHQPHRGELSRRYAAEDEEFANMFERYRDGVISEAELKQSYVEAIDVVEPYAEALLDELEGKTVITADHGENLGETQFGLQRLGHGHETTECRFVPWLELPHDGRKEITRDEPVGIDYADQSVINDRLEDLGYL
jgi:hypothetical protein